MKGTVTVCPRCGDQVETFGYLPDPYVCGRCLTTRQPEPAPQAALELEQLALIPSYAPKARATDPPTSHVAGEIGRMRGGSIRAKLLTAFYEVRGRGGLTDEQAAQASGTYRRADGNLTEFATRCSELRNLGLIVFNGKERMGSAGVAREVSEITYRGIEYVQEANWR